MDPPTASRQASPPVSTAVPPHLNHPDSVDDAALPSASAGGSKLRLMCSYGGHIVPRPHDRSLCYVGGDTRIVVADRRTSLADLTARLSKTLLGSRSFALKYQLPGEDLDSLVSVTTDEDLENMIDEYDRTANFPRPSRLRLFLFPSIDEGSAGSEGWFNGSAGLDRRFSDSASVNCLLGLDDDAVSNNPNNPNPTARGNVADSPLLETTSSFGSASSSSSSTANLPPIRVHVEDGGAAIATGLRIQDQKLGIEEQFAQIGVSTGQKQNEGFVVHSSPPNTSGCASELMLIGGEYANWVVSDDERSDHGVPVVYMKPPIQQLQSQPQQKPSGGTDLASPDSVSSDDSVANPLSRAKPNVYQEQLVQIPLVTSKVNANPVNQNAQVSIQHQVAREPGYVLQHQLDQQQQQFVHSGGHYIQHHPRGVPIQAYYQVYHPHQQQYDHQYQPVYYMPARPVQAYNIIEAPASTPSSLPQTPPSPAMAQSPTSYSPLMSPLVAKQEMGAGMYRTTTPPQMVQVPSSQRQQYIGFSQMQYPSQSVAPASNYAYEYVEPAHAPMYYTQPLAPTMSAAQYQTMTGAGAVVLPDGSAQHPNDGIKQQIRTSQAM